MTPIHIDPILMYWLSEFKPGITASEKRRRISTPTYMQDNTFLFMFFMVEVIVKYKNKNVIFKY